MYNFYLNTRAADEDGMGGEYIYIAVSLRRIFCRLQTALPDLLPGKQLLAVNGIPVETIEPDVRIEFSFRELARGIDLAWEYIKGR